MNCDLLCTNRGGIDRAVGVPQCEMIWPGFLLLLLPLVFACVQWYMPSAQKVREDRAGIAQEDRSSGIRRAWRAVAASQWWPNAVVPWQLLSNLHEVSLVVWWSQPESLWASDYITITTIVVGTSWHYWGSLLAAHPLNWLLGMITPTEQVEVEPMHFFWTGMGSYWKVQLFHTIIDSKKKKRVKYLAVQIYR